MHLDSGKTDKRPGPAVDRTYDLHKSSSKQAAVAAGDGVMAGWQKRNFQYISALGMH